jgi:hypothetical protein
MGLQSVSHWSLGRNHKHAAKPSFGATIALDGGISGKRKQNSNRRIRRRKDGYPEKVTDQCSENRKESQHRECSTADRRRYRPRNCESEKSQEHARCKHETEPAEREKYARECEKPAEREKHAQPEERKVRTTEISVIRRTQTPTPNAYGVFVLVGVNKPQKENGPIPY